MSGTRTPRAAIRSRMWGTAAAASGRSTVMRTSSEPAAASSSTCSAVAPTSAVSVLVMDWTAMGAPPPMVAGPISTLTDSRRREAAEKVMLNSCLRSYGLCLSTNDPWRNVWG